MACIARCPEAGFQYSFEQNYEVQKTQSNDQVHKVDIGEAAESFHRF